MKFFKLFHKDDHEHHHHHDNHHECGPNCNHDGHHHDHDHDDDEDDYEEISAFKQDKVKVNIIPEKKANQITFANFLKFFPMVGLPYSITSDTQRIISIENDPLSAAWMFDFVLGPNEEVDEYTEYMPCFSLPTHDFFALVYWEAGLEGSTYYLVTYSKTGVMIDKAKIAGTKYAENGLYQMVCTISPNWLFSCAEGRLDEKGHTALVSPTEKHIYLDLQLTNDGEIISI